MLQASLLAFSIFGKLLCIFRSFIKIEFSVVSTHAFISGPGGPCPNCPPGWWCCGKDDQCFNPKTFMCCNDNVTATCGRQSLCCAGSCFDADEEMCCGGTTVVKRCSENSWCCAGKCYDPDEHHCCDNELFTCPPDFICCGRGCYNPDTQLCCNRTIAEKCGGTPVCCGERCYNVETERCDIDHGQFVVRKRFFRKFFEFA